MKYPQDKFTGSMSADEFEDCLALITASFHPFSNGSARRARLVLVDGVTVRELAEQEGVCRETINKPVGMVFRAKAYTQHKEPSG